MRRINGTAAILVAIAATIGALIYPIWSYEDRSGTGLASLQAQTVSTKWGPLSAVDRDFLVKVRLAGLWELPAGRQAMERAPTKAIRDAGDHLAVGHADLDRRARDIAAKLGVELPNEPTEQQQGWLREMTEAQGEDYQRKFANLLRVSHGKVFGLIGKVRHSTRNELIRDLADAANITVLDHITMLENTGMVDFDTIAAEEAAAATQKPAPPPPPPSTSSVIGSPVPVIPPPGATSLPSAAPETTAPSDDTGQPAPQPTSDQPAPGAGAPAGSAP
ncbi:DUF4142 domain-containing protein [Streptomyces sp. F63]|uniref:DUF4142 domain-containing protein n=1 Tax=Streptomyces sp. F63 TaxID=2824887 RepID=UPI001B3869CF|nr:DUF4142 domain-containing protein [Streptomyces sp. F63]MBQ0986774.1 DUF4142 domain-containing protein [Streptomyces sp. F63]